MSFFALILITLISGLFFYKMFSKGTHGSKNLPGGSLGFPVIGETFSFLQAQAREGGSEWLNDRISKHGSIFKTSLMGCPTIVIVGQAGNKFVLGAGEDVLVAMQPTTIQAIGGKYSIFGLTGSRYKMVKGAMMSFLKPESLQNYIIPMDNFVKDLLKREFKDKDSIKAVITMKKLTFYMACNILFGIKDDDLICDQLFNEFFIAFKALWSLPVNFPGTTFWKGLRAKANIAKLILPIMRKRREELGKGNLNPTNDVLTSLLALRDENQEALSDDVVIDNFVTLMIAGHDTSAILLSLMIQKLARDPEVYKKVFEEHMDIIRKRGGNEEKLTWGEIQKMKYTWRVAQELMRIIPPVFGNFRRAAKDISYDGYDIPNGWHVFWVACGTHMEEKIFDDPKEFNPSRFENPSRPIPPFAYIPFGAGIHTCIGSEFARVQTLITIHNLLKMYEWSEVNPEEKITRQPMPYPSMGLPIKLNPRNPSW